jgi:hypothetical protein
MVAVCALSKFNAGREDHSEPQLVEGSGCFFHDKMIAPVLQMGRGLLPPRKANTASVLVGVKVLNSRQ